MSALGLGCVKTRRRSAAVEQALCRSCAYSHEHDSAAGVQRSRLPSRPGEFRPEPLTDSGRDTLASSGSCHRTKAAAFRWDLKLLPLTVGSFPTPMTCPLCSAGIAPLHRLYDGHVVKKFFRDQHFFFSSYVSRGFGRGAVLH